jgi:hypothetical protein
MIHRQRRLVGQRAAAADECSAKVVEDAVAFLKDGLAYPRSLILPEISEPLGRKFAIPNRMLDVFVAEIVLQRTSIHTLIGELEPSRVPQHVGMDRKRHLGGRPEPRHHPAKGNCGHRSAALAHENISSCFLFALETAQGAKFDAGQWVDGRDPIFKSIDVQAGMDEIGLVPAQRT